MNFWLDGGLAPSAQLVFPADIVPSRQLEAGPGRVARFFSLGSDKNNIFVAVFCVDNVSICELFIVVSRQGCSRIFSLS